MHILKHTKGQVQAAVAVVLCLLLCACGGKKEEPVFEPVELELLFLAEKDMNPNLKGRPSPLAVKVFELKGTALFEESDYFSLQTDAKAVLAEEFAAVLDSFVIRPGSRKEIRKPAKAGTTALGIIAGYRTIDGATWQALHALPMPPEAGWFSSPVKVRLQIQLQESDMQIVEP